MLLKIFKRGRGRKKNKKGDIPARVFSPEGHREEVDNSIASPSYVAEEKGIVTVDGRTIVASYVSAYPARAVEGWIADEFTWRPYCLDCVQFVEPTDEHEIVSYLNRRITQLEAKLEEMRQQGRTDTTAIEKELQYMYAYRERLVSRQTRLFKINTLFYVNAASRESAEKFFFNDFAKRMRGKGCQLKRVYYRPLDAFRMLLPEGRELLKCKALVDTDAAASCFPFAFPTLLHETGVLYGLDVATRTPIIVDRFRFAGHNEVVVGKVGSGKSFFVKLEVARWILNDPGVRVYLVDPLAGFRDIASVLDAQVVTVGRDVMNPLDLFVPRGETPQSVVREKLMSLMEFFSTFFEEEIGSPMDKTESGVLRKAILKAYADRNYEDVVIDDVIAKLTEVAEGGEERRAVERVKSAMNAFTAELSVFNGLTNVDIKDRAVYFDFSKVEGVEKSPLLLHAVLTWIGSRVRAEEGRKIVVIDEVHYFLAYGQIRRFLERSIRHSRHHKTGYTLLTQGYDEFVRYEEGRTIIANADIHVIFRQEAIPEVVRSMLDLSSSAEKFVREAAQGKTAGYSSALLVTPAGKFYVNVFATPEELAHLGTAGRGV